MCFDCCKYLCHIPSVCNLELAVPLFLHFLGMAANPCADPCGNLCSGHPYHMVAELRPFPGGNVIPAKGINKRYAHITWRSWRSLTPCPSTETTSSFPSLERVVMGRSRGQEKEISA